MDRVVSFLRDFEPSVDAYFTSLFYLPLGYRAVKVGRSGDRVVAVGYGVVVETNLSDLVASVGGVRVGAAGRLQTA